MNRNEIHLILLYEFKLDHKAAEASRNINFAFGAGTVSERTAQEWFQKFRSGDMSVEEKEGRGRPSKIDSFELKAVVELNQGKRYLSLQTSITLILPPFQDI